MGERNDRETPVELSLRKGQREAEFDLREARRTGLRPTGAKLEPNRRGKIHHTAGRRVSTGGNHGYHAMLVVAVVSIATVLGAAPLLLRLLFGR